MIDKEFKIEIAKEVLIKSGFQNDIRVIDSIAEAMIDNRFFFDIENNELVAFVCWEKPQEIDGKKKVFVKDLWIDPKYRNRNYVIRIRSKLRRIFPNTRGIWFNRKNQKMIERI